MRFVTASAPDIRDSVAFEIVYDGPALAAHEMDVRDLARALLSTGNLFQELSKAVDPAAQGVSVNIRATAPSSFLVELHLIYQAFETGLLSTPVTATDGLFGLLGGFALLFNVFKRRSTEVSREILPNETVRITYADGTSLEVPSSILRASGGATIQRELSELVRPLARDGVTEVTIRRDRVVIASANKAEAATMLEGLARPATPTVDGVILGATERETFLTIRTAGFATGRWSFSDGASQFTAAVRDDAFLDRVHTGESFSELDVLHCLIRETQVRDARGLRTSVEILEVRDHLPPLGAPLFDARAALNEPEGQQGEIEGG